MKTAWLLFFASLILPMNALSQTAAEIAAIWDNNHISKIIPSDVRHKDLKAYLEQIRKLGVKVEQVGLSNDRREIYQMEWGKGPLKVFMWSQMHGDEPTATSALIDMFAYFQTHREEKWVQEIEKSLTLRAVPMLNPDGAEAYKRHNLQDIDINRDALDLRTPEGQLLKRLRDDWNPVIGLNLHNQGALTTVGRTPKQAAISLLVVYGDEAKTTSFGHERNQRVASAMTLALQNFIPGHIGRYGDEWTPNAFGDNFSAWGTPVILIETGALHGKDEMYLVKMNFVAFVTALRSIVTGSEKTQSPEPYLTLPHNGSGGLVNFVFRRANIIDVKDRPVVADIAAATIRRRASFAAPSTIRALGNIGAVQGLDEYDAGGFQVVHRFSQMRTGQLAEFYFYRRDRVVDFTSSELEKAFPPDAIFSTGKWFKGEGVVPKISK